MVGVNVGNCRRSWLRIPVGILRGIVVGCSWLLPGCGRFAGCPQLTQHDGWHGYYRVEILLGVGSTLF